MLDTANAHKKEAIGSVSRKKVTATETTIDKENDKKRDRDEVDLFALNKWLCTEVKHLGVLIRYGMLLKDVAIARSNGDPDSPLWNVYEQNFAEINKLRKKLKH